MANLITTAELQANFPPSNDKFHILGLSLHCLLKYASNPDAILNEITHRQSFAEKPDHFKQQLKENILWKILTRISWRYQERKIFIQHLCLACKMIVFLLWSKIPFYHFPYHLCS